ncbi:MAG: LysM peptidoglycan-binding domain-containing protein [Flavobacterium sp.]
MKLIRGFAMLCIGFYSHAQEMKEHIVLNGETILAISKSYNIDPSEIYRYNRFALEGINEGMTLKFPTPVSFEPVIIEPTINEIDTNELIIEEETSTKIETPIATIKVVSEVKEIIKESKKEFRAALKYTVQQGETLYSLSKRFEVSLPELYESNPGLKEKGLQARQILNIPASGTVFENSEISVNTINYIDKESQTSKHLVKKGETLFGLAKQYGINIEKLKKDNENLLKNGLQIGQTLIINK